MDAFAAALYLGSRITLEDGLRDALVDVVAAASRLYAVDGVAGVQAIMEPETVGEIFILDPYDNVFFSTDSNVPVGRPRLLLNTDLSEIQAARGGRPSAGLPFRAPSGYLLRAYTPIEPPGFVLGIVAAAPSFTNLDALRRIFWTWIVLSAALAVLVVFLYGRAVRQFEMERMRAERGERFEALSRMSAAVAHEIRNPLNIISATLELRAAALESGTALDPEAAMIADLREEVDRLERVVHDFLDLSREQNLQIEDVEANEVVELVAHREERRLAAKSEALVEIRCVLDRQAGLFRADRDRIIQALANIVRNATEAAGARGRVEVSTARLSDAVLFVVDDSGPGIAPGERTAVFEPFLTTKKRGTGLGLAVVKAIVEAHDGSIEITEGPLGGARFTMRLPRSGPAVKP